MLMLTAAGVVAFVGGLAAAVALAVVRRAGRPLLPTPAGWAVPWGGADVAIVLVLVVFLPGAAASLLDTAGFFRLLYGPEFPPQPQVMDHRASDAQRATFAVRDLWVSLLLFPVQLAAVLLWLLRVRGVAPADLGLAGRRWPEIVVAGYVGWLILAPLVYAVHFAANFVAAQFEFAPDRHPLSALGPDRPWFDGLLLALRVTVIAPFWEELIFRGLLIPLLLKGPKRMAQLRCRVVMGLAIAAAGLTGSASGGSVWPPLAFAVLLGILFQLLNPMRITAAVFASATLFAAVHSSVWPTPVPLFVLGVGLGFLFVRTGSLGPCVIAHGLFNAVSALYLLFGGTG
jgi:membrane protease YdiL (CAAX protease family)